jgi:hypothetical protein
LKYGYWSVRNFWFEHQTQCTFLSLIFSGIQQSLENDVAEGGDTSLIENDAFTWFVATCYMRIENDVIYLFRMGIDTGTATAALAKSWGVLSNSLETDSQIQC